jgi:hypothetical protein
MRRTLAMLLSLAALVGCGGPTESHDAAADPADCDTVFVFRDSQPVEPVLAALRGAELRPVEVRFGTEGAADGTTGGGIGSPGSVGSVDQVESGLQNITETTGVEPTIIGIRVSGIVETSALGALQGAVHTRTSLPQGAAVAIAAPEHGGAQLVRTATC